MKVELERLSKQWDSVTGVEAMDLEVEDGEFVALVGPSGCGKTTTLLLIAGIYKPTAGNVRFDGRIVNRVPPKDRNVGMVFQSYALYPHMTVSQNINYPLKLKRMPKAEMRLRTQRVVDMMDISHLMDRKPAQLSGGEQQRVALSRALVKEPGLLLFDEPLSNLDAGMRLSMRGKIKRLQLELGITSIYVTHDQAEAMSMASRIALIKDGNLHQYATPEELYDRPRTMFTAGFIGNPPMNFVPVEVSQPNGHFHALCDGIDVIVPPQVGEKVFNKENLIMGIRPENVTVGKEGVAGEVYVVEPLGRDHLIDIRIGDVHIHALADPKLNLRIGENVKLNFDGDKVQFFDLESERALLW